MPNTLSVRAKSGLILLLVWLLSAAYLGMNLRRGWVPHDEGYLGQSAERVLNGELPHRDFIDPYTGGLAFIDAMIFKIFGIDLLYLRFFLFTGFLAWVPALYAIARDFSGPWPAAGVTLLGVAWSVPNFTAALPSWFCLFFATFGTLAILKYIRQPRSYWLVLAGMCGGSSFLMKSPGLYFIAGGLLFLTYRERCLSLLQEAPLRRTVVYSTFVLLCLTVFLIVLARVVLSSDGSSGFLHFYLPPLVVALFLVSHERFPTNVGSMVRFRLLLRMVVPFLCGVALPMLLLLVTYLRSHAVHELFTGLFVLNFQRLSYAHVSPQGWALEIPAIIMILILTERTPRDGFRPFVSRLKILLAAFFLGGCFFYRLFYSLALHAAWGSIPVIVVAAVLFLWPRSGNSGPASSLNQQIVLLISVTSVCSLIQFPFAIPIYFCYIAPFAVLCIAALLSGIPRLARINLYVAGAFFALFAALVFRPGFLTYMNYGYHSDEQVARLSLPRSGGLRIPREDAAVYEELIPFVAALAHGQPILAGPDCPEVYFLAGLRNPTRTLFEFFEDPQDYSRNVRVVLESKDLKVAVVHQYPQFSQTQRNMLTNLVQPRFPQSRVIGDFIVYWRD